MTEEQYSRLPQEWKDLFDALHELEEVINDANAKIEELQNRLKTLL